MCLPPVRLPPKGLRQGRVTDPEGPRKPHCSPEHPRGQRVVGLCPQVEGKSLVSPHTLGSSRSEQPFQTPNVESTWISLCL